MYNTICRYCVEGREGDLHVDSKKGGRNASGMLSYFFFLFPARLLTAVSDLVGIYREVAYWRGWLDCPTSHCLYWSHCSLGQGWAGHINGLRFYKVRYYSVHCVLVVFFLILVSKPEHRKHTLVSIWQHALRSVFMNMAFTTRLVLITRCYYSCINITFCKVLTLVCDNASNNDTMTEELGCLIPSFKGKQARVRCFAHILNLVVKVHLDSSLKKYHGDILLQAILSQYSQKKVTTDNEGD